MLDSGEDKPDSDKEYYGLMDFGPYLQQETQWLASDVKSEAFRKAQWRIAFCHVPPDPKPDRKFIRDKYVHDNWVPLLNDGALDLMICGHTHQYAELPVRAGSIGFPVIVGGTDTVIRVDVSSGQLNIATTLNDGSLRSVPFSISRRK